MKKKLYAAMAVFFILIGMLWLWGGQKKEKQKEKGMQEEKGVQEKIEKIEKSEEEWKALLDEFTYSITREKGTERAFTGKYWDHKEKGIYYCVACNLELFSSETKFRSGTGWPSFTSVIKKAHVEEKRDLTYGMVRTEVICARCDSHLGHLFPDGPKPSGLRYCINSASLRFKNAQGSK